MLEFKRDDVRNHDLAKELVAFLNLEGGTVLLEVDDDRSSFATVSGRTWPCGGRISTCRTV